MTESDLSSSAESVLLIEDSPSQLFAVTALLRKAGYVVQPVASAEDGARVIEEQPPRIILCDVVLPGMDGFEFCRRLRSSSDPTIRDLPFVLVTSMDRPEDVVKGLEAGASDYVPKPINERVLLARMRTQLRLEEMRRELARRNEELRARNAEMERNLDHARLIHRSFLPSSLPCVPGFEVAVRYLPHDRIGGDHYDLVPLEGGRLLIFVGDVSGHGIAGALFTAMVKLLFDRAAARRQAPAAILGDMNLGMSSTGGERFFLTALCALCDAGSNSLSFANAGHPSAWVRHCDGSMGSLDSQTVPLNISGDTSFSESELPFSPGECALFYTDGVIESRGAEGQLYGEERLRRLFEGMKRDASADAVADAVVADVVRFVGGPERDDDLSVVVVRRLDVPRT
ncbi:MAG: SpoIIE family protein phosphatase [Planctomycetota bacterium]